jgi:6-pyruvoyltetrahydropterin/6-carboxytetrahydropterin synthase
MWLEEMFDHKVVVDKNDPMLYKLEELESVGLAELTVFDGVGVEKFSEYAFKKVDALVREMTNNRCWCVSCECAEHGANSAIYEA